MDYYVYSIFDDCSKQSVMLTLHHTTAEAEREFNRLCSQPQIQDKKNDLKLILIGDFNTSSLELNGIAPCTILSGSDVIFEGGV